MSPVVVVFQFTHPGRGATPTLDINLVTKDVSIHAPREGCDFSGDAFRRRYDVSIHAPREGCDADDITHRITELRFQFTHPGRGATISVSARYTGKRVSIHAPREGCDSRALFGGISG